MLPELARPAPATTPDPAAKNAQDARTVEQDLCNVHRCFQARRRTRQKRQPSAAAQVFFQFVFARWGRTRLCFESQRTLAADCHTTLRTIRRWEAGGELAGYWRREKRGHGRQLVLLVGGHLCPPGEAPKADTGDPKADTPVRLGGHTCPPTSKNKDIRHADAVEAEEAKPLAAPVVEALVEVETLGVSGPALAGIRQGLEAAWAELGRRGGDVERAFRAAWKATVAESRAPTIRNTAGWLARVLQERGLEGVPGILRRHMTVAPPRSLGAAYKPFVPPDPEARHGS